MQPARARFGWLAPALAVTFAVPGAAGAAMPRSPELAAQGLFKAWQAKSRKSARAYADAPAIDKLFAVRRQPMLFKGCTVREEEGGFECLFLERRSGLSLAMVVEGGASAGGYHVGSLSFSSEE